MIRTYERLRAALKKEPAVEDFMDGSVKLSYDQNTLDNIVTGDLYTKIDFSSLATDLAFLRELSEAQRKSGARAAQRKVDALPLARQQELVQRARQAVGLTPLSNPFADDAEDATFTAITCNDTDWPQGRGYGEVLAARLGPRHPAAPALSEPGESGDYAADAPLTRIAGFTKAVSGYLHS